MGFRVTEREQRGHGGVQREAWRGAEGGMEGAKERHMEGH